MESIFMFICLSDVKCQILSLKYPNVVTGNVRASQNILKPGLFVLSWAQVSQLEMIVPYHFDVEKKLSIFFVLIDIFLSC